MKEFLFCGQTEIVVCEKRRKGEEKNGKIENKGEKMGRERITVRCNWSILQYISCIPSPF